ncbi:hypothetical protein GGI24_003865 [Coemansia furcata]|nr:hypothetical protein GGI24_003865 [Coemansia furcata]
MSQASHETDSDPSTPSKSKKSDRRAPKSKAEVSERMRRWRTENAEKNRLNDLRCRVYRQARIRFGKDPTPEREAWIQSEIFRRLERRRLREVMKGGNGSIPAPMGSPTSMEMGFSGSHGGAITRSRSTVHPFPIHMNGPPPGSSEHVMGFNTSYAMMTGSNVYDPSQHHGHQSQHYAEGGGVAQHHGHPHHHHHQQHMQQAQHGSYLPQAQGYAHHQHQQQQQQGEHLGHNFMGGASGALPSADIYGGFKFISPLYQGRLLPPQGMDPAQPTAAQSLYAPQSQYMHPQQQHQQQQHQGSHPMPAHSVPSHQPAQVPSSRDQTSAAAAAAAAAAAVADLSSSFQLPQAPAQSIYPYYQESVPTWEATASSAEMSNGQSHSSPSTPTETLGFGQSQYTLHAVDHQPVYPVVSSNALQGAESAAAPVAAAQTSAIAALSMVNPIASMPATDANVRKNEGAAESGGEPDFSSMVAAAAAAVASNTAPRVDGGGGGGGPSSAASAGNGYLYGYPGASTSPNNVASSIFSMRQIGSGGPQSTMPESDAAESANAPVNRLAAVAAAAAAAAAAASSSSSAMPVVAPKSYADAQHLSDAHGFIANAEQGADAHHLRRNMVQSPSFNVNVLSENVQFQNYS